MKRIAILGAGNSGCAAAAHLTMEGYQVAMFNRSASRLAPLKERGGIRITGAVGEGFVKLDTVTTDLGEAVEGADLLMVVAPAAAHDYYANELAKVIDGPVRIMLNPGHTGGALHFLNTLRKAGVASQVHISETNTNTYICRLTGPAEVAVYGLARKILFAAIPGKYTAEAAQTVGSLYPCVSPVGSVLDTGLANLNAVLHPAGMLLNAGWLEHTGGDFAFYYEGTTPAVGRTIDAIDRERLATMKALGLQGISFVRLFYDYGATSEHALATGSAFDALRESEPDKPIRAPKSLKDRYLEEDIPYGLVPMAALADLAGVPTPVIDSLVTMAATVNERDYWSKGLTLERMGLKGLDLLGVNVRLYEGF